MSTGTVGFEFVPSISVVTGMSAAENARELTEEYQQIVQEEKDAQQSQEKLTVALGQAAENTLDKAANSTESQATSTAISGGGGLVTGGLTVGVRLARSTPDAGMSTVTGARQSLIDGKGGIYSGNEADLDEEKVGGAGGKSVQDLGYLRNINFKDKAQVTNQVESDLSSLKNLKGAKGSNTSEGKLYDDVLKKIDSDKKESQSEKDSYQGKTDLLDRKLSDAGQALSQGLSSIGQFNSASATRDQATASKEEKFAQFASDSMNSNVQSQAKSADSMADTFKEVMRNNISDLARANSPV